MNEPKFLLLIKSKDFLDAGFKDVFPFLMWRETDSALREVGTVMVIPSDRNPAKGSALAENPTLLKDARAYVHFGNENSRHINQKTAPAYWANIATTTALQTLHSVPSNANLFDTIVPFSRAAGEQSTPWDIAVFQTLQALANSMGQMPCGSSINGGDDHAQFRVLPPGILGRLNAVWEKAHAYYTALHPLKEWSSVAFPVYLELCRCANLAQNDWREAWRQSYETWQTSRNKILQVHAMQTIRRALLQLKSPEVDMQAEEADAGAEILANLSEETQPTLELAERVFQIPLLLSRAAAGFALQT